MSQMETHVGILMKVDKVESEPIEIWCKDYCNTYNIEELPKSYDSWEECFIDKFGDEYIIHKDNAYRIIENKEFEGEDIFEAEYNDRGQIKFVLQFYNDGCGFSEAIEEALDKLS